MCGVVLRMRGEAGGARGKAGVRSGSNYPPISAAYWLPPSNPTPYHVPGSVLTLHLYFKHVYCVRRIQKLSVVNRRKLSYSLPLYPVGLSLTQSTAMNDDATAFVLYIFCTSAIFFQFETESVSDIDRYAD